MLARTLGMVRLGNVSLDGTKMKANASKHKAMSWDHANKLEQQLQEEVAALLSRAEAGGRSGAGRRSGPSGGVEASP